LSSHQPATVLFSANSSDSSQLKYAYRYCTQQKEEKFGVGIGTGGDAIERLSLSRRETSNTKAHQRHFSLRADRNEILTKWEAPNVDECIQDGLLRIKSDVYNFYTTDNFEEKQILIYLSEVYKLFIKNIKLNTQRSIHDVSAVLDTLFYLLNAQVGSID
jgi:hypothetical protein